MKIINKDPWPVPTLIVADIVTVGLALLSLWVTHGSEYLWAPLLIALVITAFFYCNAIYCCEQENKCIDKIAERANVQSQISNLSNKVDLLQSQFNNSKQSNEIRPHN